MPDVVIRDAQHILTVHTSGVPSAETPGGIAWCRFSQTFSPVVVLYALRWRGPLLSSTSVRPLVAVMGWTCPQLPVLASSGMTCCWRLRMEAAGIGGHAKAGRHRCRPARSCITVDDI